LSFNRPQPSRTATAAQISKNTPAAAPIAARKPAPAPPPCCWLSRVATKPPPSIIAKRTRTQTAAPIKSSTAIMVTPVGLPIEYLPLSFGWLLRRFYPQLLKLNTYFYKRWMNHKAQLVRLASVTQCRRRNHTEQIRNH